MELKPPASVAALFEKHYPAGEKVSEILTMHSAAVCDLSLEIGRACGAEDLDFIAEAAWLHDIGIRYTQAPGIECHGEKPYLWHGVLGREICDEAGLPEHGLVCERHVGTGLTFDQVAELELGLPERAMLPQSQSERIICYADKFFSKDSAQRLSLQDVRRRIGRHGAQSLARFEVLHREFQQAPEAP